MPTEEEDLLFKLGDLLHKPQCNDRNAGNQQPDNQQQEIHLACKCNVPVVIQIPS
jgi:hypothetical protein